jgi:hypothetical protein
MLVPLLEVVDDYDVTVPWFLAPVVTDSLD